MKREEETNPRRDVSLLGMWVFLATEAMFFGGVIGAYVIYRVMYPQAFLEASHHMNVLLGSINTAVLLSSSFFVALAVHAAEEERPRATAGFLFATVGLAIAFLAIKALEYGEHIQDHLWPGALFRYDGANANQAKLYFGFYFVMTGLHALHVIVGIAVLSVGAVLAWRGRFKNGHVNLVEGSALYWHLVDIVWIFLFPLLYLIGRH